MSVIISVITSVVMSIIHHSGPRVKGSWVLMISKYVSLLFLLNFPLFQIRNLVLISDFKGDNCLN
jgi:hypothetical protein